MLICSFLPSGTEILFALGSADSGLGSLSSVITHSKPARKR